MSQHDEKPKIIKIPDTPRPVAVQDFDNNPTVGDLTRWARMNPDKCEEVRIPQLTPTRHRRDPIRLNGETFRPGSTVKVHPLIAEELRTAISNFDQSFLNQFSGNTTGIANDTFIDEKGRVHAG